MFEKFTMEIFYLGCVVVGGGLFILRSITMFVGLGGDDDVDGVGDVSDDMPVDTFKLVSTHSLTAFVLMFGLVGYLVLRSHPQAQLAAAAAGFGTGLVTMFIIAKIFSASRKLQSDGTIYPRDAVGATGSVYLDIKPGAIGKVQVTARGALKIFDARAADPAASLKTGDPVKVTDAADVLIVQPL